MTQESGQPGDVLVGGAGAAGSIAPAEPRRAGFPELVFDEGCVTRRAVESAC